MKLFLKSETEAKLYVGDLQYDLILKFVEEAFQLEPETIYLTFEDDERDRVAIHSQEDIDIMVAVLDKKEYAKIYVDGSPHKTPQQLESTQPEIVLEKQPQELRPI